MKVVSEMAHYFVDGNPCIPPLSVHYKSTKEKAGYLPA